LLIDPNFFKFHANPFSDQYREAMANLARVVSSIYADFPGMKEAAYGGLESSSRGGANRFFYARITDDKPIVPKDQQDTEEENPINQWRYAYEEVIHSKEGWVSVEGGLSYTFPPEGEEEGDAGGWAINGAEAFNDKSGVEGAGINVDDARYSDCQLELKPIDQGVVIMRPIFSADMSDDNLSVTPLMYFYAANDHDFEQPG